jgi:hypothetical protein
VAKLLKRTFNIDLETCHACGSQMKIVSAITEKPVIRQILRHLGLKPDPPHIQPPKSTSVPQYDFFYDHTIDSFA